MPSLFAIKQAKALPVALLLLLNLSTHTIAAPYTPVHEKPILSPNGGFNMYPLIQEDLKKYSFPNENWYFNRDFRNLPLNIAAQQRGLIIHGDSTNGPSGTLNGYEHYDEWDETHDIPNSRFNDPQRSSSNNVEGWGKARAEPAGNEGRPPRIAGPPPQDRYYRNPPYGRTAKREENLDTLLPQAVCDFLQLPEDCSKGLTLPPGFPDIPITSIGIERLDTALPVIKSLAVTDAVPVDLVRERPAPLLTLVHGGLNMEAGLVEDTVPPSRLGEYDQDTPVSVFLNIEFLPSAAAAFDVEQAITGVLNMPDFDILANIPYTETTFEYHELQTVCMTREVGVFVVCERVYGEIPEELRYIREPTAEQLPVLDLEIPVLDLEIPVLELEIPALEPEI